jgi:hypothetical protein
MVLGRLKISLFYVTKQKIRASIKYMKTIEKIAIDKLAIDFAEKNAPRIQQMISSGQALQIAKKNYNEVTAPLTSDANAVIASVSDELTPEGLTYFYDKMKELSKIPFSEKK